MSYGWRDTRRLAGFEEGDGQDIGGGKEGRKEKREGRIEGRKGRWKTLETKA